MATVNYVITPTKNPLVWVVKWTGMAGATSDVGQAFDVSSVPGAGGAERSVHIRGTFGTTTVTFEGSNDGTNYITLADPQGNAISKTAEAIETVLEYTRAVRPKLSGGNGTGLECWMIVRGSR